jgi:hypothetical protein
LKSDTLITAYKILLALSRNPDLQWSHQTLTEECKSSTRTTRHAIQWLLDRVWIYRAQGYLHAASDGIIALQAARGNTYVGSSAYQWIAEVRSGMDARGNQTTIENAVVPKRLETHNRKERG